MFFRKQPSDGGSELVWWQHTLVFLRNCNCACDVVISCKAVSAEMVGRGFIRHEVLQPSLQLVCHPVLGDLQNLLMRRFVKRCLWPKGIVPGFWVFLGLVFAEMVGKGFIQHEHLQPSLQPVCHRVLGDLQNLLTKLKLMGMFVKSVLDQFSSNCSRFLSSF